MRGRILLTSVVTLLLGACGSQDPAEQYAAAIRGYLEAHPAPAGQEPSITAFGQCPIDMAQRLGCNTRLCNIVRPQGETYHGVTPGTQSLEETRAAGLKTLATLTPVLDEELTAERPETRMQGFQLGPVTKAESPTFLLPVVPPNQQEPDKVNVAAAQQWWRVMDLATGKPLAQSQWKVVPDSSQVEVRGAVTGHEYRVIYLTIVDSHVGSARPMLNPMLPGVADIEARKLDETLSYYKRMIDIWRPTSAGSWTYGAREPGRRLDGWFSANAGTNPEVLDMFEEWAGKPFDPLWLFPGGRGIDVNDPPTEGLVLWYRFVQEQVAAFGRRLNETAHQHVQYSRVFWGDHWTGLEPWEGRIEDAGFDETVKAAHNSVVCRMTTGFPGKSRGVIRFSPWLSDRELFAAPDPALNARKTWTEIKRAAFFQLPTALSIGGHMDRVPEFPGLEQQLRHMTDEYRVMYNLIGNRRVYTHDLNVYVVNAWGRIRSWISWGLINRSQNFQMHMVDLPVNVRFISIREIAEKGVPADADVLLNCGEPGSSWSGGWHWQDDRAVAAVREFVENGGGLIGIGAPSHVAEPQDGWRLAPELGVDFAGASGPAVMQRTAAGVEHWITTSLLESVGNLWTDVTARISGDDVTVLYTNAEGAPMVTARSAGAGRAVYLSAYGAWPEESEETFNLHSLARTKSPWEVDPACYDLLRRSIFWTARQETALDQLMSPDELVSVYWYPSERLLIVYNNRDVAREVTVRFDTALTGLSTTSVRLTDVLTGKSLGDHTSSALKAGLKVALPPAGALFLKVDAVK